MNTDYKQAELELNLSIDKYIKQVTIMDNEVSERKADDYLREVRSTFSAKDNKEVLTLAIFVCERDISSLEVFSDVEELSYATYIKKLTLKVLVKRYKDKYK